MESRRDFFVAQVILDVEKIKLLDVGRVGDVFFFFFFRGWKLGLLGFGCGTVGPSHWMLKLKLLLLMGLIGIF